MLRLAAMLTAAGLVAACAAEPAGTFFPQPIGEVRERLARTPLPPFVFGQADPSAEIVGTETGTVWIVRHQGAELMRYTADLAAEQAGTRIRLSLVGSRAGRFGDVERRFEEAPKLREMYLVAMEERIASSLERRGYSMARVYPAMIAAAGGLDGIATRMERAGEQARARDRANIEKAYRDEARGIRY